MARPRNAASKDTTPERGSSAVPLSGVYRVTEGFAVPGNDGFMLAYQVGQLVSADDPISSTHRAMLETVEAATANPGERRTVRLPSGVTVAQATEHMRGHAHQTGDQIRMAHSLPPEDPNSAASPFAPFQPGAGVVADDVPEAQNPTGGVKAADYSGPTAEDLPEVLAEKAELEQNEVEKALAEGDADKAAEVKDGGQAKAAGQSKDSSAKK